MGAGGNVIAGLAATLEEIKGTPREDLIGRSRLGELAFVEAEESFDGLRAIATELLSLPLGELPLVVQKEIASCGRSALAKLAEIQRFSVASQSSNVAERKQVLVRQVLDEYVNLYRITAPFIAVLRTSTQSLSGFEAKIEETLLRVSDETRVALASLQESQAEATRILDAQRKAAAETGISQHSKHFLAQANEHKLGARIWLSVLSVLSVAGLLGAASLLYSLYVAETELTTARGVQIAIGKLVTFSLVYFMLVVSAKNYRAHQHNYVVNRHRQNALSTFEAFVRAAGDDATRNAVLLRSTEAIFSLGSSGHSPGGEADAPPTHQILEIFRAGASKG